MRMIQMYVGAVGVDRDGGSPIVILSDAGKNQALPIFVGLPEAQAISMAVAKVRSQRPMTHELLLSIIKRFGYRIREIVIDEIDSNTFKALIHLDPENAGGTGAEESITIDARPSDAIALATIAGAPVFVAPQVLSSAGVPIQQEPDEAEEEEFKKFLGEVKASDFKCDTPVELPEDEEAGEGGNQA